MEEKYPNLIAANAAAQVVKQVYPNVKIGKIKRGACAPLFILEIDKIGVLII